MYQLTMPTRIPTLEEPRLLNLSQAKTHWLGALPILICTHHFWFLGIPRGRVELDVLARLHKKNLLSHPEARCNGPDSPCVCLRMKTDMKWEDV